MIYSVEEIKESIGFCGLVCSLCNMSKSGECRGCRGKCDDCSIKKCAHVRKIDGCWECDEFPCDENIFKNMRNRTFVKCAKEEGVHKLAEYLKKNDEFGIEYHKSEETHGDYDGFDSEDQILQLLRKKQNPYERCPVYETKHFILRMVEEKDAEDLLECYSDPESIKLFNSDNCDSDFSYRSLEEMNDCIKFWLDQYSEEYYVRFSLVDKLLGKVIGTIEFFARPVNFNEVSKVGVLRLDLASKYERATEITELVETICSNFYKIFEVEHIITKAIPEAKQRIEALESKGFEEFKNKSIMPYDSYFIRYK